MPRLQEIGIGGLQVDLVDSIVERANPGAVVAVRFVAVLRRTDAMAGVVANTHGNRGLRILRVMLVEDAQRRTGLFDGRAPLTVGRSHFHEESLETHTAGIHHPALPHLEARVERRLITLGVLGFLPVHREERQSDVVRSVAPGLLDE